MDHSRIEEHNLIDRYVRGTLPADERAEFEEHFVDCAACQEQIEAAKSLRLAVRESVTETRASSGWRWTAIAACACLGIALAASSMFLFERQSARSELASLRSSLDRAPVVFGLSLSRDASEPRAVTIPAEPRWMVFLAEIDATRYSRYRAALIGGRGEETWSKEGIEANSPDSISVAVPSAALHPGAFTLVVSGTQSDGSFITVARFPLHLAAQ
ncbi:MAG: zf-HC2 domain-containing protein [Bryobacteraceae bacterium]|jgi:anti-sigma factor RsiW